MMTIVMISERLTKTTAIQVRTADIEEMGIKLRLTIVDTPGIILLLLLLK